MHPLIESPPSPRSAAFLGEVFLTSLRPKVRYLLKVSTYCTVTASLVLYLHSGPERVAEFIWLLLIVPIIVSIPACFLTVHREIMNEELTRQLRDALAHDPLTRARTRQELYARFDATIPRRVVAMIDADHFKRINDTHGHLVGDEVLRRIADLIRAQTREDDTLCRFGGEEFVLLLIDTDPEEARQVCQRIRESLSRAPIQTSAGPVPVTVSIGLTPVGPFETIDTVIARADEALYQAKHRGRNRVEFFSRAPAERLESA